MLWVRLLARFATCLGLWKLNVQGIVAHVDAFEMKGSDVDASSDAVPLQDSPCPKEYIKCQKRVEEKPFVHPHWHWRRRSIVVRSILFRLVDAFFMPGQYCQQLFAIEFGRQFLLKLAGQVHKRIVWFTNSAVAHHCFDALPHLVHLRADVGLEQFNI